MNARPIEIMLRKSLHSNYFVYFVLLYLRVIACYISQCIRISEGYTQENNWRDGLNTKGNENYALITQQITDRRENKAQDERNGDGETNAIFCIHRNGS
jgi:hypothetical protein